MSSDRESSTMKTVYFSGKPEAWDNWEFGFEARAVINRYDHILNGDSTCPTKVAVQLIKAKTTTLTDEDKSSLALYKANSQAFADLASSLMGPKGDSCSVAVGILKSCRTEDLPAGDAFKGFKALRCKV